MVLLDIKSKKNNLLSFIFHTLELIIDKVILNLLCSNPPKKY